MRDDLVGQAVKRVRTGGSLQEVEEGIGADFTAEEWTEVRRRWPRFEILREDDKRLGELIEEAHARELAARDEAKARLEAETAREQTALSREQTALAREQTALSRWNLWVVPLLALVTTAIGAGVALYTGRQTVQEMHDTAGVQTLLALHQEFESEPMHQTRARAAKQLLKGEDSRELDDVLDFFETVAVMVRRDAVDAELAWQTFSYEFDGYVKASRSLIRNEEEASPAVWEELDGLRARFDEVERATRHHQEELTDVHEFLRYERALRQPGSHGLGDVEGVQGPRPPEARVHGGRPSSTPRGRRAAPRA